ncbi:MAG TPA: PAS domain-containing protein [Chryseosolibacter sp.]
MRPEGTSPSTIKAYPFEAIANTSPVPILMWDHEQRCTFANHAWLRLTQSSFEKNLGMGWLNFVYAPDREALLQSIQQSAQRTIRIRIASDPDPINLTVRLSLYAVSSSVNCIIGWMNEADDPLKTLEKKFGTDFNHRMNLMETVLDSTLSMITVIDPDFNIVYYNSMVESYTGVGKDLVLGQNVLDVFPYLRKVEFESYVHRALKGETVQTPVTEAVLQKGRYFESFYIPLRNADQVIQGVIIKVRDRSVDTKLQQELIETNKLLEEQNKALIRQSHFSQSLFDSTIDVIAVVDREYRYISINKRGMERYNVTKEQIEGKYMHDLFPSVKHSGMYRDITRALNGEFVRDVSYKSEVLNQAQFENFYVPLRDAEDHVYAVMVIGHDVTEIMRANERLKASNAELAEKNRDLERSNSDLEQFAYVASHDLQEPIRKIATYANKLLTRNQGELSEETTVYLQRINNSTRRMYELINGLLSYSRLVRQQELFSKTSLDQTIKQIAVDFDLRIRAKRAIINLQNELPSIEAIPVQMNQLFSNLISNSLKFSKDDVAPVIQIASLDLSPEQVLFYELDPRIKYVSIFYIDNGIGFDQQFADKIFELFQRLHQKNKYEGSGIGLAICKKIINNHHGLISVFSEEGKGTSFHIILPYTQKF